MRFVHRPTEMDALQWQGDLEAMRQFTGGEQAVEVQAEGSGLLWVIQGANVFPVVPGHWVIRWSNGRIASMSDDMLRRIYVPKREAVSA